MGAGKSLLAKRLAAELGCAWLDLDDWIEEREGMTIPEIFAQKKESVFRELEAKYLRLTNELSPTIVATGGGTPCFSNNLEWMNEQGVTIYLEAKVETLFQRLRPAKTNRPLISEKPDDELRVFIAELLAKREEAYSKAQFVCKADLPIGELSAGLSQYFSRFLSR